MDKIRTVNDVLLYFVLKHEGDWGKIYDSIWKKEDIPEGELEKIREQVTCDFVTIVDPNYPDYFKHLHYPPYILFYKGNFALMSKPHRIAVIGSRRCSSYGTHMCQDMVTGLVAADYVIISGLAKGIDAIAHNVALENKGQTIAVIGSGFNHFYPQENIDIYNKIINNGGLVISEYPENTSPKPDNFPARNRIIAAIEDVGTLVIEARRRSGTLITVGETLRLGQDVYCVPERADVESSCNLLIQEGAHLALTALDITGHEKNHILY